MRTRREGLATAMSDLVTILVWALLVGNALRPPRLGGRAGLVVYVLSLTINELPLLFLVLVSTGVVSTLVNGAPEGLGGVAWSMAWALIVAGLLWLQIRVRSVRPALEGAFAAALGNGWRATIRPDLAASLSTRTPWLAGTVRPFQRQHPEVVRIRNVAYGPDPRAHQLDLYRNPGSPAGRPILIHFHEGGFVRGRKSREAVNLLNQLAAHGWLCISANYRLRADAAFPNPLLDAKRAIAWAREHAAENGADPTQLFLAGCSAGAHMAVSAALTPNQPRFQPGFEQIDTTVAGVVSFYGYLGARTEDPASSPLALAQAQAPPMLLIQGRNDTMLPLGGPAVWAKTLRSRSRSPVVYAELPHAQHAFDLFASVRARVVAQAVEAFLAWSRSHPN